MARTNPISFLLNRPAAVAQPDANAAQPAVDDPAFSLTKVLATAATVLTPLTAILVTQLGDVAFSAGNIVALVLGVLGFLAVASAADVLARGAATGAEKRAEATQAAATGQAVVAKTAAKSSKKVAGLTLKAAQAESRNRSATGFKGVLLLQPPVDGRLITDGPTRSLTAHGLAEVDGGACFLCSVEGELQWLPRSRVEFTPAVHPQNGRAHGAEFTLRRRR
jgi:hypothetical protein